MTQPAPAPVYGGVDVPECWGVDTVIAGALSDEQLRALAEFDLGSLVMPGVPAPHHPTGRPLPLWGYAPLPGEHSPWDWTAERLRAACDAGLLCGIVQHCRRGMWTASAEQGDADGKAAAEFAALVGYPADCYLAQDDEAVANPGIDAVESVYAWARAVCQQCKAATYEGFSPGLTALQEYDNPLVDRYWGAVGPWDVAVRGVCCRQGATVRIGGVAYDLDRFAPDRLGGVLRLMGRIDLHAPTDPPPAA